MAVLGWGGIAANWDEFGFNFLPLVQKEVFLACSLDVLFLRKGGQGNIVINGDIDARLKTLFDALQKPQQRSECGGASPTEEEKPFFVLLENDNLISEIKVTTEPTSRLLGPISVKRRRAFGYQCEALADETEPNELGFSVKAYLVLWCYCNWGKYGWGILFRSVCFCIGHARLIYPRLSALRIKQKNPIVRNEPVCLP